MAQPAAAPSPLRLPPHSLEAELAVLEASIAHGPRLDAAAAIVRPEDFYHGPHRRIFGALLQMRAAGTEIDFVTLADHLRSLDQLEEIGGPAYLAKILSDTPASANVGSHAQIIRTLSRRRRVIAVCQESAARGYGDVSPTWEIEVARAMSDAAELDARATGPIDEVWGEWDRRMLDVPPAPQPWLLKHPTRDGEECPAGQGDGMLPLGKVGMLSSEGGAGKTYSMVQLAFSVATGVPWLGHFDVASEALRGRVCIAMAEEAMADWHRRAYPTCEALKLTPEEKDRAWSRIQPLPLHGRNIAMLAPNADGQIVETEVFYRLRAKLRETAIRHAPGCPRLADRRSQKPCAAGCMHGWSLIVIDPLVRWAGPESEKDNHAATRFIQLLEALTEVPGNPTVLVVHHSSKDSRGPNPLKKANARGVSGITDAARWHATLSLEGADEVLFIQAKSNYSKPMKQSVTLKRAHGGFLRVHSEEEERHAQHVAEERSEAKEARERDAFERKVAACERQLLAALRRVKAPISSRKELASLITEGNTAAREAAITRLKSSGAIAKAPKGGFVVVELEPAAQSEGVQSALF